MFCELCELLESFLVGNSGLIFTRTDVRNIGSRFHHQEIDRIF